MPDVHLSVDMEGDDIDIVALGGVINDFRAILQAVESSLTNEPAKATWHVEEATGFRTVASPNGVNEETLHKVVERSHEGFRRVEQAGDGPVNWPQELNARARRAILRVFKHLSKIDRLTIEGDGVEPLTLTRTDDARLQVPAGRGYHEVSQLDGKLDLISVRNRLLFVIEEHVTGVRVPCTFPGQMADRVKDALGKRVIVEGLIRYNANDIPTSVTEITDLFIRPKPLKTLEELVGSAPDFTGGIDPVRYVRQMRESDDA